MPITRQVCPKMTNSFNILQRKFAQEKDFKMISFSIIPWIDSMEVLKDYGEKHNINVSQWHLLTEQKEAIYELGRQSFFAEKTLGLKGK